MSETEQQPLTDQEMEDWRELRHTPHEDLTDEQVTSKVRLSMKRRYSAPEWSLVFEFTGPNGRRADAIAVNTFPSRNFKIVGFEIKASRNDWLAEKREAAKADYFVQCVDEWYVVAGRRGIVKEEELPDGWGLLELKDNRDDQLWNLVESDLTEHQQGGPDRAFWGRLVQKVIGEESEFTTSDLEEARRRGYDDAKEDAKKRADRELEKLERKAESYDRLEEAGFDFIRRYGTVRESDVERINRAYRLINYLDGNGRGSFVSELESLHERFQRSAETVDERLADFREEFDELADLVEDAEGGSR